MIMKIWICLSLVLPLCRPMLALSCYKCSSINGSNPACEDLFQGDIPGNSTMLNTPCFTRIRGRHGLFPATHCIKLIAFSRESKSLRYTYRTCGRDDTGTTALTRSSHCGFVKLDWIDQDRSFRGCLHICDRDACNHGRSFIEFHWTWIVTLIFIKLHDLTSKSMVD